MSATLVLFPVSNVSHISKKPLLNTRVFGCYLLITAICFASLQPVFVLSLQKLGFVSVVLIFFRYFVAWSLWSTLTKTVDLPRSDRNKARAAGAMVALCSWCYYLGLQYASVSFVVGMLYTFPLFILLWSIFKEQKKVSVMKLLAFTVAFVGLFFCVGAEVHFTPLALVLGLGSAVLFGLYIIKLPRFTEPLKQNSLTAYVLQGGWIVVLVPMLFYLSTISFSWQALMLLLGLSILATLVPIVLLNRGLAAVDNSLDSSILLLLEPVVATLFSIIIINEVVNLQSIVGVILMVIGAGISVYQTEKNAA